MSVLGELVKNERLRLGITQAELARRLKLEASFLSRVESGQVRIGPKHTDKLAKVLGIDKQRVIDALKASPVQNPEITNYQLPSEEAIQRLFKTGMSVDLVGKVGKSIGALAVNDAGETTGDVEPIRINFNYPNTVAVAVKDSSFAPIFQEGDKLVFAPTSYLPNDIVLVKVKGGSVHIGHIAYEGDTLMLEPVTENYRKVQIPRQKVAFIRRMIARILP